MCSICKEITASACQSFPPAPMAAKMSAIQKVPASVEVGNIAGSITHRALEQDDYRKLRNLTLQYLLGTA